MRRQHLPLVFLRIGSSRLVLASVLLTICITATVATALASFDARVLPLGARQHLASPQSRVIAISGHADAAQAAADTQVIRRVLDKTFGRRQAQLLAAVWSNPLDLPGPRSARVTRLADAAAASDVSGHARLAAGTWPGPPRQGLIPAALPASVAGRLGLRTGSVLTVRDSATGAPARLQITGLYLPRQLKSPFWQLDLVSPAGASAAPGFITYGPLIVSGAAFRSGLLTVGQASWVAVPSVAGLAGQDDGALAGSVSRIAVRLDQGGASGLQLATHLPAMLQGVAAGLVVARFVLLAAALQLLVVAVTALSVAGRMLIGQREAEHALLSARGVSPWWLARLALTEALLVGIVAAAAGTVSGGALAAMLLRTGSLRTAGPALTTIPAAAWLAALAVLGLCTAVLTWPAVLPATRLSVSIRTRRQAMLAGLLRAGADAAVAALALLAVWQLRSFSAAGTGGRGGTDPVLAAAPALALVGSALLLLRLIPMVARLIEWLTERASRLAGAMASWQISRRPVRQAGPVLLMLLAVAAGTLALSQWSSWRRSAQDQAAFATGADIRLDTGIPPPLASAGLLAHAVGVRAAFAVTAFSDAPAGQVIGLNARQAARTVQLRSDMSALPAVQLWRRIVPPGPAAGLTLPGRPARLEILASLSPGAGPRSLGQVTASASVRDAGGAVYSIPAGQLPADGRVHGLVVPLSASRQADYPLRLMGIGLGYTVPASPPATPARGLGTLTVAGLAVSAVPAGGFAAVFAPGTALRNWLHTAASADLAAQASGQGTPPSPVSWQPAPAGGQQLVFRAGDGTVTLSFGQLVPASGQLTLAAPPAAAPLPGIATQAFLHASHVAVGAIVPVTADGLTLSVRIVAAVRAFPTVPSGGALIVDLPSLQQLLVARAAQPLPATQWWLRVASGAATARGPVIAAALPAGTLVTDRKRAAAALLADPLSAAPQQAVLAIAAALAVLAIAGVGVSVAARAREGLAQGALLSALGVSHGAQARILCLEQLLLSVPAAAAGLLLGAGLCQLIIPAVTIAGGGRAPVPPPLIELPLGLAAGLALATAAIPVLAAAAASISRPDPAAQLRTAGAP